MTRSRNVLARAHFALTCSIAFALFTEKMEQRFFAVVLPAAFFAFWVIFDGYRVKREAEQRANVTR